MKGYSDELAHAVYDVLVNVCGAAEDDRSSFVYNATTGPIPEWRFCGDLGFGGKYRGERYVVDCYPEDVTPERLEIIDRANAELAKLNPAYASRRDVIIPEASEEANNNDDGYTFQ